MVRRGLSQVKRFELIACAAPCCLRLLSSGFACLRCRRLHNENKNEIREDSKQTVQILNTAA